MLKFKEHYLYKYSTNEELAVQFKQSYTSYNTKCHIFETLIARQRDSIFFFILKMVHNRKTTEDLVCEWMARVFNGLPNYSADFMFSTWSFKIATNLAIDNIRSRKEAFHRELLFCISSGEKVWEQKGSEEYQIYVKQKEVSDREKNPEDALMYTEKEIYLQILLKELLDKMRRHNATYSNLIELYYFDGLTYEEISGRLDLPLGTVKAGLFRAKEELCGLIIEKGLIYTYSLLQQMGIKYKRRETA